MNWESWSEFAAMSGYGLYVWGSFGMTAAVVLGELGALRARRRALGRTARLAHKPTHRASNETQN